MIDFKDREIQSQIDTLVRNERPLRIAATDPRILVHVEYDISEAEKHLSIWASRHKDDCYVEEKNPLTLRIYPTFFHDPDMRIQRDTYVARKRRVSQ